MSFDRVERLIGRATLETLAGKRVGVVGLGSGGGFVALSLAMSGVGHFVLVDDDTLETANVVRHVADLREVGKPKAVAVAELIRQRNPNVQVETFIGKFEDHADALDGLDLLVVGVDSELSKYAINEACLQRNLPAVYAGVYAKGEGGDVVVIQPYQTPCYACWAAELRGEILVQKTADESLDYGMIGESGTLEAEPGLWLHVVRVAAAQADMALNELLRGASAYRELPGNTVVMANTLLEIIEGETSLPYSAVWVTIPRDPHCLVCGRREHNGEAISLESLMASSGIVEIEAQQDS
jgi:molybdopterin/thiamine biosynthesis adenylyltransferase